MFTAHGEQTEKPFGAAEMEEPGIVPGAITDGRRAWRCDRWLQIARKAGV